VHAVSIRGLSKKYGDFLALEGVSLDVEEGTLFALVGPNGAGKTTLLRILTTQLPPSAGEAFVLGMNVATEGDRVRRSMSYVPQEMSVWTDITGYENLLIYAKIYGIPAGAREKAIADALDLMELSPVAGRMVREYSGGMIRKLEIASAMMLDPKILFLDEPTIGLDPAARKAVWEKLRALNSAGGTSVFFTTHYMDEAESYADTIGIINRGKLVKAGSPDALRHSAGNEEIRLELETPAGKPLAAKLSALKGVAGVRAEGNSLEISVEDAEHTLNSVMESVIAARCRVKGVSVSKPTLYDAFLKYAGAGAEAQELHSGITEIRRTRKRITGA